MSGTENGNDIPSVIAITLTLARSLSLWVHSESCCPDLSRARSRSQAERVMLCAQTLLPMVPAPSRGQAALASVIAGSRASGLTSLDIRDNAMPLVGLGFLFEALEQCR